MSVRELLEKGEAAFADLDFDDALRFSQKVLALEPGSLDALDLQAHALAELGDYPRADEAFAALLERQPKDPGLMLAAASVLIRQPGDDRERIEDGLALVERARPFVRGDDELLAELETVRGIGLSAQGESAEALRAFDRVLALDADHLEARLERAIALFELCRFEDSQRQLERVKGDAPDDAAVWHYLGLIAERRGRAGDAERAFAQAHALDPDTYPEPTRLSDQEFDRAVKEAIDRLPAHARPHLENVVIDIQPIPSDDDLKQLELSPLILGLFRGQAVDERSPVRSEDFETARITLYQKNLERFVGTREELLEEIGVTVLHEVGHLLGLDEGELYDRGLD